jgi:hypothetical protein
MRLHLHRGQALLLVVVGGLAAAVVGGAAFERYGLPAPVAAWAAELLDRPATRMPSTIDIGGSGEPAGSTVSPTAARPGPTPSAKPSGIVVVPLPQPARPTPAASVVPAIIYTYPPDDHGGRHGGDGS